MAGLIDTNILLYAVNSSATEYLSAREFLSAVGESPDTWYLSEGIVYEFLRVSTHSRVFDRPLTWEEALGFLETFWSRPNVALLAAGSDHWSLLSHELGSLRNASGNLFFDIRSWVLMLEYSIQTIYTADTDFLQFPNISVINPLRAEIRGPR